MPEIVSNTTPLISLLKLNRLNLLQQIYSSIYIPKAVYYEIEAGKSKAYYQDLLRIDWVKVVEVKDKEAVKNLRDLDACKAEPIVRYFVKHPFPQPSSPDQPGRGGGLRRGARVLRKGR